VPFDQLKNKFTTEAATGGGPDLLIGPKDWIGELANAGLVAPLDDVGKDILAMLRPSTVDANKFKGQVWAFPESFEAVALFYNKDMVPNPPKDTDELLALAKEHGLAWNTGFYHSIGLLTGFGGQLFDADQKCILDQGDGTAKALDFMYEVGSASAASGVVGSPDGGLLDALFKDGKAGMVNNGPWATGDYQKALGKDKVGVAPLPTVKDTGQPMKPFLGTKNIFLSANSQGESQTVALAFVKHMLGAEVQTLFATEAGHLPANKDVTVDDPIVQGFLAQAANATYFPNEPEMGAVWGPAGDMIIKVIEGKASGADAVKEACTTINTANKK
jgi:maltose-binding protein MalE